MLDVCGDTELMSDAILELSRHELFFAAPGTLALAPTECIKFKLDGKMRVFLRSHLSDREIEKLLSS